VDGLNYPGFPARHCLAVDVNWLKMDDKSGPFLRVEMVICNPEEFCVRNKVAGHGQRQTEWVAMRKGVSCLFRFRDV